MENQNVQIKIPEKEGFVSSSEKEIKEKFRNIDIIIYTIVVALIIVSISSLISVCAIIIDQLHFNSQTYREFSNYRNDNDRIIDRISDIEKRLDLIKK